MADFPDMRHWIRLVYTAGIAVLAAVYLLLPDPPRALWWAIGLSSVAAIGVGVRVNRPAARLPWLLLAAGTATLIAGDITYDVLTDVIGLDNPFPSAADVLYLVSYPLFAVGLLLMVRARSGGADRGALLDALVVTIGLGLLSWVFLAKPYVRDTELTLLEKAISVAYPLGDILVLAVLARLLIGGGRSRSAQFLAAGTLGLLAADVVYGLTQLNGNWSTGGPVDAGWIVFYATFGAAALTPDMAALAEPAFRRGVTLTRSRLLLLTAASLMAPGLLLVEAVTGADLHDAPVIAVVSAVLFVLVTVRLDGLILVARGSAQRERALRRAGEALVATAGREDICHAGVQAALEVAGSADHRAWLALETESGFEVVEDTGAPGVGAPDVAGLVASHREPLLEKGYVLVGGDGRTENGRSCTATLLIPLTQQGRLTGVLVVVGPNVHRSGVIDAVGTLGAQMVLALGGKALMEQILQRRNETTFRALIQNASDVILVVDRDLRVSYHTPSVEAVLGYRTEDVNGRHALSLFPDEPGAAMTLTGGPHAPGPDVASEWRVRHADGTLLRAEVTCRDLRDDPSVNGMVLTLHDVTERRKLEEELKFLAFHDSLTGLPNRGLFLDRVEHASLRRGDASRRLAVMLIDLDDFKLVNDTRGHATGDALLVAVAERLRRSLRAGDTAARLGGDEFALLVEDLSSDAEARSIAERVLSALREPYVLDGELMTVCASLGVATAGPGATAAELLRQADLAMYAAKDAGKGGQELFQPEFDDKMAARLRLRRDLERGLDRSEFVLHYQPIVELASGEITGVEALVRWQHPTRGLVMPGEFIAAVEDTDLAVPLGAWVLEHAVEQAAAWWREFPAAEAPRLSVNVAPRQLRDPGFVDSVAATLVRHDFPARALVLEITERTLAGDDSCAVTNMAGLRTIGVSFALDDFGTGYSSLAYLRRFPVDVLKIDRAFVNGIEGPDGDRELVEAIVRLGDAFGLGLVAEGIETEGQRAALHRIGCTAGQGFLFSRPVPADAVTAMLAARSTRPYAPAA